MSEREFENFYRERLEEDIILALSKQKKHPFGGGYAAVLHKQFGKPHFSW